MIEGRDWADIASVAMAVVVVAILGIFVGAWLLGRDKGVEPSERGIRFPDIEPGTIMEVRIAPNSVDSTDITDRPLKVGR